MIDPQFKEYLDAKFDHVHTKIDDTRQDLLEGRKEIRKINDDHERRVRDLEKVKNQTWGAFLVGGVSLVWQIIKELWHK